MKLWQSKMEQCNTSDKEFGHTELDIVADSVLFNNLR